MPTHAQKPAFERSYKRLLPAQQALFEKALQEFIMVLLQMEAGNAHTFPDKLRVKKIKGLEGCWEMTWATDGRAIFSWGKEQLPGKRHVVWVDIGSHNILP